MDLPYYKFYFNMTPEAKVHSNFLLPVFSYWSTDFKRIFFFSMGNITNPKLESI